VRSKAGISQLNLPHGTRNRKLKKSKEKANKIKTNVLKVSATVRRGRRTSAGEEKVGGCDGKDLQKRKVLNLE